MFLDSTVHNFRKFLHFKMGQMLTTDMHQMLDTYVFDPRLKAIENRDFRFALAGAAFQLWIERMRKDSPLGAEARSARYRYIRLIESLRGSADSNELEFLETIERFFAHGWAPVAAPLLPEPKTTLREPYKLLATEPFGRHGVVRSCQSLFAN
jgi:hypothetical protein